MTTDDFAFVVRYLRRRRPFQRYEIGFTSGERVTVAHPETITQFGRLFVYRAPDRSHRIFSADGVSELFLPPPQSASA